MMRSIYLKTLYERRYFVLGWTLGLVLLSVLMVAFFPAMRQDNSLDALIENMPAAFQGFVGDLENLRDFDRYLASQLFDIRASMVVGIMAIIIGVGLSTREEESGELRTIIAQSVSRTSYFAEKWLAMVTIIVLTVTGLVLGVYIAAPFVDGANIAVSDMFGLTAMTTVIMTTFASLTFSAGVASGKKSFASLFGIIVIVGSYLVTSFSAAVNWLKDIEFVSLLYYFPAVSVVSNGIDFRDVIVLSSVSALSLFIAWAIFRRRDIN